MAKISVDTLGLHGVNVDKNPLELDDNEVVRAQNAISDPAAGRASLRKRPGLLAINTRAVTGGTVLGGIDLPLQDLSASGIHWIYLGRGPTS